MQKIFFCIKQNLQTGFMIKMTIQNKDFKASVVVSFLVVWSLLVISK